MSHAPEDEPSTEDLLGVLEKAAPRPLTVREIAARLDLDRFDPRAMAAELEAQVARRRLRRIGKTRYQIVREVVERKPRPSRAVPLEVVGRYTRVRGGFGFVEVPGKAGASLRADLLIPYGREGDALHGDTVRARIVRHEPRANRVTGAVVEVIDRGYTRVLGRLESVRRSRMRAVALGWRLVPFVDLLPVFDVAGGVPLRAEHAGRTALIRSLQPPDGSRPWRGSVEQLLGDADDPEVQLLQICLENGLRTEFSPAVLAEADRLPRDPGPTDCAGREDLRGALFVTIDGETARDFDDAVCLETTPSGSRLRVAIADVSHYVKPGSTLDAEASARGTSVYFPDRAIPMLPERLSTELCSLNPDRDRVVLVADMLYDRAGVRQSSRFFRGVIRSRARLTYAEVAALLADPDRPDLQQRQKELGDVVGMLGQMHLLMGLLYGRRVAAGSLDLDLPESLVDISEEGRAIDVRVVERNDAHRIIEELMLEANRAVAEQLERRGLPLPYRIHEVPDPEAVAALNDFLHPVGLHLESPRDVKPKDVQGVLEKLSGHRLERVLTRRVLRALKQARYSTENAGHFGLAFPLYCHFTSPIRRYPDLLVHRQLGHLLDGEIELARAAADELAAASDQSSRREREAMAAERAMVDLKKAEFMLGHLHEPGPATIVSVARFGFFVEIDAYPVEGLVPVEDLPGFWRFDERSQTLLASGSGSRFRLGDRVQVEATQASVARRQITFSLVEERPSEHRAPPRFPPRGPGPRSSGPWSSGPRSSGPRSSGPRSSDPRSSGPRSSGPRSSDPRSSGPRSSDPRSSGPRSSDPRSSDPRSSDPRSSGPRSSDPRSSDPRSSGPRSSGPRSSGPRPRSGPRR